jgi:pyrroline-5-carboxylate reductase
MKTIGFIGGGRITKIFLNGWQNAGLHFDKVIVSDKDANVLANLKAQFPHIEITHDNTLPASRELVFISLHPPVLVETLGQIKDSFNPQSILVSLAPKITLNKLSEALGQNGKFVRMNPNAPSIINKGYNPVVFSNGINVQDKEELLGYFKVLGESPEVEEANLEAYAIISAMGPTYLWFQLYQLKEIGREIGLSEEDVKKALQAMVSGALETMFNSGLTPAEVMDLVPVKPIGDQEETIKAIYSERLPALHQKIKP